MTCWSHEAEVAQMGEQQTEDLKAPVRSRASAVPFFPTALTDGPPSAARSPRHGALTDGPAAPPARRAYGRPPRLGSGPPAPHTHTIVPVVAEKRAHASLRGIKAGGTPAPVIILRSPAAEMNPLSF